MARSRVPAIWLGLSISPLGGQFTITRLALVRAAVDRLWYGGGPRQPLLRPPRRLTGAMLARLLDRYRASAGMGFDSLARAALIAAIPTLQALGSFELWARFQHFDRPLSVEKYHFFFHALGADAAVDDH